MKQWQQEADAAREQANMIRSSRQRATNQRPRQNDQHRLRKQNIEIFWS